MASLFNCKAQNVPMYVGTYTDGSSEGIYRLQFNIKTGALSSLHFAASAVNPSYIAFSKNKRYLYAVNESTESVSAFKVEKKWPTKILK